MKTKEMDKIKKIQTNSMMLEFLPYTTTLYQSEKHECYAFVPSRLQHQSCEDTWFISHPEYQVL
jgi:hypothetical protein